MRRVSLRHEKHMFNEFEIYARAQYPIIHLDTRALNDLSSVFMFQLYRHTYLAHYRIVNLETL